MGAECANINVALFCVKDLDQFVPICLYFEI